MDNWANISDSVRQILTKQDLLKPSLVATLTDDEIKELFKTMGQRKEVKLLRASALPPLPKPDPTVEIGGTKYSLLEIPHRDNPLVEREFKRIKELVCLKYLKALKSVFVYLQLINSCVPTQLKEKVRKMVLDIKKITDQMDVAVAAYKTDCNDVLQSYKKAFQYLNSGDAEFASTEVLQAQDHCSKLLHDAETLSNLYQSTTEVVLQILQDITSMEGKKEIESHKGKEQVLNSEVVIGASVGTIGGAIAGGGAAALAAGVVTGAAVAAGAAIGGGLILAPVGVYAAYKGYSRSEQKLKPKEEVKLMAVAPERNMELSQCDAQAISLTTAKGSIGPIIDILTNVSKFWTQMMEQTKSLFRVGDTQRKHIEILLKRQKEDVVEYLNLQGYKEEGVTLYARWVALQRVCELAHKEFQAYRHAPTGQEVSIANIHTGREPDIDQSNDAASALVMLKAKPNSYDERNLARLIEYTGDFLQLAYYGTRCHNALHMKIQNVVFVITKLTDFADSFETFSRSAFNDVDVSFQNASSYFTSGDAKLAYNTMSEITPLCQDIVTKSCAMSKQCATCLEHVQENLREIETQQEQIKNELRKFMEGVTHKTYAQSLSTTNWEAIYNAISVRGLFCNAFRFFRGSRPLSVPQQTGTCLRDETENELKSMSAALFGMRQVEKILKQGMSFWDKMWKHSERITNESITINEYVNSFLDKPTQDIIRDPFFTDQMTKNRYTWMLWKKNCAEYVRYVRMARTTLSHMLRENATKEEALCKVAQMAQDLRAKFDD